MYIATARVLALIFGTMLFGLASHATAQDTNKKRDAVIEKCIARAHREYRDPGEAETFYRARTAVYKSCMFENGEAP
jgi:hypothetical protein